MFFHCNQFSLPNKTRAVCNNTLIVYLPEVRFLSIYITENLKLHVHICSLCSSVRKVLHIVESLEDVLSPYMLRSIYFA
jgi:hypothetical protein